MNRSAALCLALLTTVVAVSGFSLATGSRGAAAGQQDQLFARVTNLNRALTQYSADSSTADIVLDGYRRTLQESTVLDSSCVPLVIKNVFLVDDDTLREAKSFMGVEAGLKQIKNDAEALSKEIEKLDDDDRNKKVLQQRIKALWTDKGDGTINSKSREVTRSYAATKELFIASLERVGHCFHAASATMEAAISGESDLAELAVTTRGLREAFILVDPANSGDWKGYDASNKPAIGQLVDALDVNESMIISIKSDHEHAFANRSMVKQALALGLGRSITDLNDLAERMKAMRTAVRAAQTTSTAAIDVANAGRSTTYNAQIVADRVLELLGIIEPETNQIYENPLRPTYSVFLTAKGAVGAQIAPLIEAIAGDVGDFVTDHVDLYYFTEVGRLMSILNPSVSLQQNPLLIESGYEEKKAAVATLERAMLQTYSEMNAVKNQIPLLVRQLEAARQGVLDAEKLYDQKRKERDRLDQEHKITERDAKYKETAYNNAQTRETVAQTAYDDARRALPDPNDTTVTSEERARKQAALDRAEVALNKTKDEALAKKQTWEDANQKSEDLSNQHNMAKEDADTALADLNAKRSKISESQADVDSIPNQIDQAYKKLFQTSADLQNARINLNIAAGSALEAFAHQRYNAPLLVGNADGTSHDPLRRCSIYAFSDSRVIYIRGKRADVDHVKEAIAEFDRPSPMARITLWSIQMNVQTTGQSRGQLGEVLSFVDLQLLKTREKIAMATALLRTCLNKKVQEVENCYRDSVSLGKQGSDEGVGPRIARCMFYQKEVSKRLGLDQDKAIGYPGYYEFTKWTIPDPASTTTLGEVLLVLAMSKQEYREAVIRDFECQFTAEINNIEDNEDRSKKDSTLVRLKRALGIFDGLLSTGRSDGLSPIQSEIVEAIKRSVLEKFIYNADNMADIAGKAIDFLGAPSEQSDGLQKANIDLRVFLGNTNPATWADAHKALSLVAKTSPLTSIQKTQSGLPELGVLLAMQPAMAWLEDEFGLSNGLLLKASETSDVPLWRILRRQYTKVQANARIAAADEMLKTLIIAIEDDVEELFVQPMLTRLRGHLTKRGVTVGSIERTSVIATNRSAALVDPKATAQLDLSGQIQLLESARQLSGIIDSLRKGRVDRVLSSLGGLEQDTDPEFYALVTGNQFKVTPVIDPSGQAMRFQFDYIRTTNITDANGTINPQLPRIERHGVSTVVQVSSLEISEATRFETNNKLGVPTKRIGGIPLLKDIGFLSDIPFIGWFSKRNGRAAVSQQSLMFTQAAIYPTIGDITNLLTSSIGIPIINPD